MNINNQTKVAAATVITDLAYQCKGKTFGGYVRDHIVLKKSFRDIDIWFKSQEYADQFIERFNEEIIDCKLEKHNIVSGNSMYGFKRTQYTLLYGMNNKIIGPICIMFIDVVISEFFPVCDFDINCLSYDGNNLAAHKPYKVLTNGEREKDYGHCDSVDEIVENIKSKCAFIFPTYYMLSCGKMDKNKTSKIYNMSTCKVIASSRIKKFLNRGFKIRKLLKYEYLASG